MPKIKLHTVQAMQDASYFDIIYDQVELIYHDYADIFNYELIVLNRKHLVTQSQLCKQYLDKSIKNRIILLDILEGTNTTIRMLSRYNLIDYFLVTKQIMVVSSGDFDKNTIFSNIDYFKYMVCGEYNTTISLNQFDNIHTYNKPYSFLFLNKNPRSHRKLIITKLQERNLLENSLWTDLSRGIKLSHVVDDYFNGNVKNVFLNSTKHDLHWPDGVIFPDLYIKTYFSIVTETNFYEPYSYCTEKIYKPILMGHPFIVVSNYKFYQHLTDRGYKTFGNLIDESFDNIENNEDRMDAIVNSIETLCQQDLDDFLLNVKSICEHNRLNLLREVGMKYMSTYNSLTEFLKTYV